MLRLGDNFCISAVSSPNLGAPWFLITLPGSASFSTPALGRAAAAQLRRLADDVEAAWSAIDARGAGDE